MLGSESPPRDDDDIEYWLVWLEEKVDRVELPCWNDLTDSCPEFRAAVTRNPALIDELQRRLERLRAVDQFLDRGDDSTRAATQVQGFNISGAIGYGGMGVVYRARQVSLNRDVALKLMLSGRFASPRGRSRFRSEAQILAKLRHPNIVQIYEYGELDNVPYLAQELVDGGTLADHAARVPFTSRQAAELTETLAAAVHHAHENGIVHRDLKPSNVLLTKDGVPKIVDFGLAKALDFDSGTSHTGEVPGTPSYMAPESVMGGAIGRCTDVYGLGAILYELLTGQPPFCGDNAGEVRDRVRAELPILPWLVAPQCPVEMGAIALKCLEKRPEHRYESAAAFGRDLRRWLNGEPTIARPLGVLGRVARWMRRRPAAAALIAVSLAAVTALGAVVALYTLRLQRLVIDVQEQKVAADEQRIEAQRQRLGAVESARIARENETRLRRHAYAADMRVAQQLRQDGDLTSLASLLNRYILPDDGKIDPDTFSATQPGAIARSNSVTDAIQRGSMPFEWRCLDRCRHACLLTLEAHAGTLDLMAFTASGDVLATSGKHDGQIRLWQIPSGRLLASFPVRTKPSPRYEDEEASMSHDGRRIAALTDVKTAVVWDVATGVEVRRFDHPGAVRSLAMSPDGACIAAAGEAKTILWSCDSGERVAAYPAARLLAFSPDGRQLAVVGPNLAANKVRLCDVPPSPEEPELTLPAFVRYISYSPDGTMLACLAGHGQNASIVVYYARTGAMRHIVDVDRVDSHTRAGFSADSRHLVAASSDGNLRFWDLRSGESVAALRSPTSRLVHFAFSLDRRWVATSTPDGKVLIWEANLLDPFDELVPQNDAIGPLVFSPDGCTLAACTDDRGVALIDKVSGTVMARLPRHMDRIIDIAFSADGDRLLTCDGVLVRCWNWREETLRWSVAGNRPACVCWSQELGVVVSSGYDKLIHVYDETDGSEKTRWSGEANITGVRFLPAKPLLVSVGDDGMARLWGFTKGNSSVSRYEEIDEKLATVTIGAPALAKFSATAAIDQFALAPSGDSMAVGCADGQLEVFPMDDLSRVPRPRLTRLFAAGPRAAFALSPDGQTICVGGNTDALQAIDVNTQEAQYSLSGRRVGGRSIAYSPDARTLATISREGCLTLWNLDEWRTRTLGGSPLMPVRSLAFSADGSALAIATDDSPPPDRPLSDGLPPGPNVRRFLSRKSALLLGNSHSIYFDGAPWDESGPGFRVWDIANGHERILPLVCKTLAAIPRIAWSPKGIIAAGSNDGTVWAWDMNSPQLQTRFAVNPASAGGQEWLTKAGRSLVTPTALSRLDSVTDVAFSTDGRRLAIASKSGIVQLVDTTDWKERTTLASDATDIADLTFAPSGAALVANRRGQLLWWDLKQTVEARQARSLGDANDSTIASVTFSHDGKRLAVGRQDGTVELFVCATTQARDNIDWIDGAERLVLTGHLDRVASLSFAPDDRTLATGSWDATVRLWHVASGQELAALRAHHDKVEAVAFSPDGSVLASGGHRDADHGEIFLWKATPVGR